MKVHKNSCPENRPLLHQGGRRTGRRNRLIRSHRGKHNIRIRNRILQRFTMCDPECLGPFRNLGRGFRLRRFYIKRRNIACAICAPPCDKGACRLSQTNKCDAHMILQSLSFDTRLAQLFDLSGKDLTQVMKLLNFKVLIRSHA